MKTIKAWRLERGLTLTAVGVCLGVSPQAVHQWEDGTRTPNARRLRELARLFGVPMDAIDFEQPHDARRADDRSSVWQVDAAE